MWPCCGRRLLGESLARFKGTQQSGNYGPTSEPVQASRTTVHCSVNAVQYTLLSTVCTVQYSVHCTVRCTLYSARCTVQRTLYSTVHTVQYSAYATVHWTLYNTVQSIWWPLTLSQGRLERGFNSFLYSLYSPGGIRFITI